MCLGRGLDVLLSAFKMHAPLVASVQVSRSSTLPRPNTHIHSTSPRLDFDSSPYHSDARNSLFPPSCNMCKVLTVDMRALLH